MNEREGFEDAELHRIKWKISESNLLVEFKVHVIARWTKSDGSTGVKELDVDIHGSVKWDGCSNFLIGEHDPHIVMWHGCSRADVDDVGKLMLRCWDIAKEKMTALGHWLGEG